MTATSELLRDAAERLRAAGVDNPRLDARVLWEHAMKVDPPLEGGSKFRSEQREQEISGRGEMPEKPLPEALRASTLPQGEGGCVGALFEQFIARRIAREPVAYITGHKEFWSLDFDVGPGVLIPRPESETLVEQVLKAFPDREAPLEFLDLGTGSGCLLIAVLAAYPDARGTGVDSSPHALQWARRNVEKHGLTGRCRLSQCDFAEIEGRFDGILANPPYIPSDGIASLAPEIRLHEPLQALDGGRDGLDGYRVLVPLTERLLAPGGLAFVEIGQGQSGAVGALFGGRLVAVARDLAGIDRCVIGGKS